MRFVVPTGSVKAALLAGSALVISTPALAQDAGTLDAEEVSDAASEASGEISDSDNVIIVSGFRQSLNAAIAAKREAVGQVDVIVAEDIAKFPDTNLAESLQRIPGVAIEQDRFGRA